LSVVSKKKEKSESFVVSAKRCAPQGSAAVRVTFGVPTWGAASCATTKTRRENRQLPEVLPAGALGA
jgi:hypothetical protein